MSKSLSAMLALCLLFPLVTQANQEVSVVTFNMYVGFDTKDMLCQCTQPKNINFTEIAKEIYDEFMGNKPLDRIDIAARELASRSPDFIGLQEAVKLKWPLKDTIDFLEIFLQKINQYSGQYGKKYKALYRENFNQGKTLSICGIDIKASMVDREAIVYNAEYDIEKESVVTKTLSAYREPIDLGDGNQFIFKRGLLGARFKKSDGTRLTLFTTHIDEYVTGEIHDDQVKEILQTIEPFQNDEHIVLVGDFDMEEGKDKNYEAILSLGFKDSYRMANPEDPGLTCCNLPKLDNLMPQAFQKVDLIFTKSDMWQPSLSEIILNSRRIDVPETMLQASEIEDTLSAYSYEGGDIWVSDHYGVMTLFESPKQLADAGKY